MSIICNMKNAYIEKAWNYNGYDCICIATPMGHRCGYVAIPKNHTFYGKSDENVNIQVHGGLTFGGISGIYPRDIEPDTWWLGFDCAHSDDNPDPTLLDETRRHIYEFKSYDDGYSSIKTLDFVERECNNMVDQIIELIKG